MSSRGERTQYSLQDVPNQDYARQLQGLPTSRRETVLTSSEMQKSNKLDLEQLGDSTSREDMMEQLATALACLVQLQQQQQHRWETAQQEQEERR